jgi:hypothetical protein
MWTDNLLLASTTKDIVEVAHLCFHFAAMTVLRLPFPLALGDCVKKLSGGDSSHEELPDVMFSSSTGGIGH